MDGLLQALGLLTTYLIVRRGPLEEGVKRVVLCDFDTSWLLNTYVGEVLVVFLFLRPRIDHLKRHLATL